MFSNWKIVIFIADVGKAVVFSAPVYLSGGPVKTSAPCFCGEDAAGVSEGLCSLCSQGEGQHRCVAVTRVSDLVFLRAFVLVRGVLLVVLCSGS